MSEIAVQSNNILDIIAQNPTMDLDKMSKLMDMQERILTKQAEIEFNEAKAKLQFPILERTGKGFNNKNVADISDIEKVCNPIYTKQGFSISFKCEQTDKSVKVIGILSHQKGHKEQSEIVLPIDISGNKNAVQAIGSTITYGRRYLLMMLLNLASNDDATNIKTSMTINDDQLTELSILLNDAKMTQEILDKYNIKQLNELNLTSFELIRNNALHRIRKNNLASKTQEIKE
jgi:hypothetical protein